MLKINNVSYDICTKGPAISHPTLILDFEPVESYDGDLFEDFKKLLEKENLIDVYNEAINYKQNIYFLFRGRIFQKENIPVYQDLFEKISKESANIQKPLLDAHKININQMKPPFFMWEGVPEDFTGIENAYTDFNVPYAIISKDTGYSPIALQQILNNPFGSAFIEWNDDAPELYKDIEEMFHGIKCFLMASPEKYEEAKKFALENKCCLYKNNA